MGIPCARTARHALASRALLGGYKRLEAAQQELFDGFSSLYKKARATRARSIPAPESGMSPH